jgi:hypothetical protein
MLALQLFVAVISNFDDLGEFVGAKVLMHHTKTRLKFREASNLAGLSNNKFPEIRSLGSGI